jgi:hypothetical protein
VEQELLTLSEHVSSPLVFSGVHVTRSLVLYACFAKKTNNNPTTTVKQAKKIQLCSEKECSGGIILLKTTKDCHLTRYIVIPV